MDETRIKRQEEQRKEVEKWEEKKREEELIGLNYKMRNKSGSAGVAISSGGLSKYNSDAKLPTLKSQHSMSLANFKNANLNSKNPISLKPSAPPTFNDIETNGPLPKLGTKSALKSSASQPPKSFSKLVRIRDDETKDKQTDNEDKDFLKLCPLGCGRKFGEENLEKHMAICQKVFTGRRDQFDISKKRWAKAFKK